MQSLFPSVSVSVSVRVSVSLSVSLSLSLSLSLNVSSMLILNKPILQLTVDLIDELTA